MDNSLHSKDVFWLELIGDTITCRGTACRAPTLGWNIGLCMILNSLERLLYIPPPPTPSTRERGLTSHSSATRLSGNP